MTEIMIEEFKTEYGEQQLESDVNAKMSLKAGFRAYKSEYIDYFLEHHDQFPLTLVLFYDSDQFNDSVMRSLTVKILDVFVYKYEKKFVKGNFNVRGYTSAPSNIGGVGQSSFEQALSLIYEDVKLNKLVVIV